MPLFKKLHFGEGPFGPFHLPKINYKIAYRRKELGTQVRKQLNHEIIYRVRPGNGHAGAIAGVVYQDKYKYVVPSSINNVESDPNRIHLAAAVDYWKNILTTEEKQAYNDEVSHGLNMSGYNLFMKKAMLGEIGMFVDRGDPAAIDFDKDDLTADDAWHDLSLTAIIPTIARAVLLEVDIEAGHTDKEVIFRENGNTNDINHTGAITKTNNKDQHKTCIVAVGSDRIIEYKASTETWTTINIVVRGWWT